MIMAAQTQAESSSFPSTKDVEFNVGMKAKREVRKTFHETKLDPITTIVEFQRKHSLHTMMAKALDTIPVYCSTSSTSKTNAAVLSDTSTIEPFQPDPVLTFLSHLGVTHQEIHKRILEALRSHLLEEVERSSSSSHNDALLELLKQSWAISNFGATEIRPVLVSILKKLQDDTPHSVLVTMANRDEMGELRYGELLSELPLRMRRLVWEADAAAANSSSSSLLQSMIQPLLQEYTSCSEPFRYAANLTFGIGITERRMATAQVRRRQSVTTGMPTSSNTNSTQRIVSSLSSRTTTIKKESIDATNGGPREKNTTISPTTAASTGTSSAVTSTSSTPGDALAKIREIVGDRPKLFNALIQMIIAQHGATTSTSTTTTSTSTNDTTTTVTAVYGGTEHTILGGERYLNCCLLSDILLTFGSSCMSKSYEHVGSLARIVDECVNAGTVTDTHVAQIQGCLRHIFEIPTTQNRTSTTANANTSTSSSTHILPATAPTALGNRAKPPPPTPSVILTKTATRSDEHLQKAITLALVQMKLDDRESIFLNPVTDDLVLGYSDVIHEPMCLSMMEEKVANAKYSDLVEFERDVKLMFQNCITFNNGKDGQWFRNEARRQQKAFRDFTLKKAKEELKTSQLTNRKTTADKDTIKPDSTSRKRRSPMESLLGATTTTTTTTPAPPLPLPSTTTATTTKMPPTSILARRLQPQSTDTKDAIEPLPFIKSKKRKKDLDGPSMPAVASAILTDPFFIRLLLHKLYRRLHETLPSQKNIPCGDMIVPSILQLLRIAQSSSQICASKGKRYIIPDVGIDENSSSSSNIGTDEQQPTDSSSFVPLRKLLPLLSKLMLDAELDRRTTFGGDLYDVADQVSAIKVLVPSGTEEGWSKVSTSSRVIFRALVQGALVHLLQPGNSSDVALKTQIPRFVDVLERLVANQPQDLIDDRPFFLSMAHGLLRFKTRLPLSTRDLVIRLWLGWLRGGGAGGMEHVQTMTSPLHEIFIHLLNEVIWVPIVSICWSHSSLTLSLFFVFSHNL